jgi:hypothetical protein
VICQPCRDAADLASGRAVAPIDDGAGLQHAYEQVAELHARCPGCDCQHRWREIHPTGYDLAVAPREERA